MISLDISQMLPEALLGLLDADIGSAIATDLADAARAKWITLAQRELSSAKRDYIDGIQPVEATGPTERTITLVGWLPNAVEQGLAPYDLRSTLLNGPNAKPKIAADGHKYRAIPFRHGTPGSEGQGGPAMGSRMGPQPAQSRGMVGGLDAAAATKLGKGIYARASQLTAKQRLGTSKGTGYVPVSFGKTKTNVMAVAKLAEHHKTDIYAGMKKVEHTYQNATQSQYMTFRMISENMTEGWMHPGITARHLATQVEAYVQSIAQKAVEVTVMTALKGSST